MSIDLEVALVHSLPYGLEGRVIGNPLLNDNGSVPWQHGENNLSGVFGVL
jgi:hypothetical protein